MKEAPILRTSPDVQAWRHLLSPRPHSSPCFRLQSRCGQSGAGTAVPKLLSGMPVQPPACTPCRPCPDNCQTALKRRLKAPSPRPPSAPSAQRGAVDHRARGGAGTLPRHPPKAVLVLGHFAQCKAGVAGLGNPTLPCHGSHRWPPRALRAARPGASLPAPGSGPLCRRLECGLGSTFPVPTRAQSPPDGAALPTARCRGESARLAGLLPTARGPWTDARSGPAGPVGPRRDGMAPSSLATVDGAIRAGSRMAISGSSAPSAAGSSRASAT